MWANTTPAAKKTVLMKPFFSCGRWWDEESKDKCVMGNGANAQVIHAINKHESISLLASVASVHLVKKEFIQFVSCNLTPVAAVRHIYVSIGSRWPENLTRASFWCQAVTVCRYIFVLSSLPNFDWVMRQKIWPPYSSRFRICCHLSQLNPHYGL